MLPIKPQCSELGWTCIPLAVINEQNLNYQNGNKYLENILVLHHTLQNRHSLQEETDVTGIIIMIIAIN